MKTPLILRSSFSFAAGMLWFESLLMVLIISMVFLHRGLGLPNSPASTFSLLVACVTGYLSWPYAKRFIYKAEEWEKAFDEWLRKTTRKLFRMPEEND